MCHVYANAITFPVEVAGDSTANLRTVNVSVNCSCGFEVRETLQHRYRANIAGMPNLVAHCEVLNDGVIKEAMCIGKEADSHILC